MERADVVDIVFVENDRFVADRTRHGHREEIVLFIEGRTVLVDAVSHTLSCRTSQAQSVRLIAVDIERHIVIQRRCDLSPDDVRFTVSLHLILLDVGHADVLRRQLFPDDRQKPLVCLKEHYIRLQTSAEADVFQKRHDSSADEVGSRKIDGGLDSRRFKDMSHEICRRTLAVGARDKNGVVRVQSFDMADERRVYFNCNRARKIRSAPFRHKIYPERQYLGNIQCSIKPYSAHFNLSVCVFRSTR